MITPIRMVNGSNIYKNCVGHLYVWRKIRMGNPMSLYVQRSTINTRRSKAYYSYFFCRWSKSVRFIMNLIVKIIQFHYSKVEMFLIFTNLFYSKRSSQVTVWFRLTKISFFLNGPGIIITGNMKIKQLLLLLEVKYFQGMLTTQLFFPSC